MTHIVELALASPADGWRRLGLPIDESGTVTVGTVTLRFTPPGDGRSGITAWTLSDEAALPGRDDAVDGPGGSSGASVIDGLSTRFAAADDAVVTLSPAGHPYSRLDHVVVTTPSLERTCGAIETATGEPLKRVRDAGPGVRQGFHRLGEVIVEVVERADLPAEAPAEFWGLVLVAGDDLLDLCDSLGPDVVGLPKPAVQKGRFIATVRGELGLGLPVALMTP